MYWEGFRVRLDLVLLHLGALVLVASVCIGALAGDVHVGSDGLLPKGRRGEPGLVEPHATRSL